MIKLFKLFFSELIVWHLAGNFDISEDNFTCKINKLLNARLGPHCAVYSGSISLPEYSGSGKDLLPPVARVHWLRPKSLSQSTLAQDKDLLPDYSGSG